MFKSEFRFCFFVTKPIIEPITYITHENTTVKPYIKWQPFPPYLREPIDAPMLISGFQQTMEKFEL